MSEAALSVIVATRNRETSLRRTLVSLDIAQRAAGIATQVVIVDNGSSDATPHTLAEWCAACAGRRTLRVEMPGKARAVNAGLEAAEAAVIAFTDDDVEVRPDWLSAIVAYFTQHPEYAAAMGRTLPPPHLDDASLRERVARYPGAVPVFDAGEIVRDLDDLFGCNMAARRSLFDRLGRFNERLGPGASGLSEDAELAQRILRAGLRIGYMPEAVVYHEVDPQRLTDAYYREFQKRLGRSEYAAHPEWTVWRAARRAVEGALGAAWWGLTGQSVRRRRAWARVQRHTDAARWLWRQSHRAPAEKG